LAAENLRIPLLRRFEYQNGGLTTKTKEKVGELIVELYRIWFPSRFGSWDAERRVYDPYFAHPYPKKPRLSFGAAAQEYGVRELQTRFPEASEAALKEILLLPLEMLECTLNRLAPLENLERMLKGLLPA
jgi:hypothetical protein